MIADLVTIVPYVGVPLSEYDFKFATYLLIWGVVVVGIVAIALLVIVFILKRKQS